MSSVPIMHLEEDYYRPSEPRKNVPFALLLKIVIISLSLILAARIFYYAVLSNRLMVQEIHISAPDGFALSNNEIVQLSGFDKSVPLFRVNTNTMASRLKTYPQVKSAIVKTGFPDRIFITITARTPVAALISSGENIVLAMDEEGVLFPAHSMYNGLPIISGIRSVNASPGDRIHSSLLSLLSDLSNLKKNHTVTYNLLSEIVVRRIGDTDLEGLVYFNHSRVKTRSNLIFSKDQIETILLMIDLVEKQGIAPRLEEIDIRSGNVVLKMREE